MHKHATLSRCGSYRYTLSRVWDVELARLLFVMLNPSKADHTIDDPTASKTMGFARRLGYGGIEIVNLYAYRATNPADMWAAPMSRVGPENDMHIRRAAGEHSRAICAWGANARKDPARVAEVLELLDAQNCRPMALRLLADGTPEHPLYLPGTCEPFDLVF